MERRTEIMIITEDGVQHLKLHGWLKRETFLVKSEQIFPQNNPDFGMFILYVDEGELYRLQDHQGLWKHIEPLGNEEIRWNTYKNLKDTSFIDNIKDFIMGFPEINNKKDIDDFISNTNETSLKLFKKNPEFIDTYIKTKELSKKEKNIDLKQMIEHFEDLERYEDCALLVKIRNKLK